MTQMDMAPIWETNPKLAALPRRLDDLGAPPVHASKLLDPAKKTLR